MDFNPSMDRKCYNSMTYDLHQRGYNLPTFTGEKNNDLLWVTDGIYYLISISDK